MVATAPPLRTDTEEKEEKQFFKVSLAAPPKFWANLSWGKWSLRSTIEHHRTLSGLFGVESSWVKSVLNESRWYLLSWLFLCWLVGRILHATDLPEGVSRLEKNAIYEGLLKLGQLPCCFFAIMSLDSHIFLLLLGSFEPCFLVVNWFLHNICQAIDQNGKPIDQYGVAEWAYLVLFPLLYLVVFPILGFQDALPNDIRGSVGIVIVGGLAVALIYSNVSIFMKSHDVFSVRLASSGDAELTSAGLMTTTQTNIILFYIKFVWNQWRYPGAYVVWKPMLSPCSDPEAHSQTQSEEESENALNPVSMAILKCARENIDVHPCMRQGDIIEHVHLRLSQEGGKVHPTDDGGGKKIRVQEGPTALHNDRRTHNSPCSFLFSQV